MRTDILLPCLLSSVLGASLALAAPAVARETGGRLAAPAAASNTVVPLQLHLTGPSGTPVNGLKTMTFKLYSVPSGGSALWAEGRIAENAVQVTDGVASVLLGSVTPLPQSIIAANPTLYLGVTVDVEAEMQPRIQLGSAPIAMTVPDGALLPRNMSALAYSQGATSAIANTVADTWFDLAPLTLTVPADSVPVWTKALVFFDARCTGSAAGMPVGFRFVVDGAGGEYTDAYPTTGQMLNYSLHTILSLSPNASHSIQMQWIKGPVAGTATCYDRRLSVILLGAGTP